MCKMGAECRVLTSEHGDPTGAIDVACVAQLADAQDGLEVRSLPARLAHLDQLLVHRYMYTSTMYMYSCVTKREPRGLSCEVARTPAVLVHLGYMSK